jgi:predicted  nucleic acid-binding Zn-ribbon protein
VLCTQQRDSATASIASNQFYAARTWLERARINCTEMASIDAAVADVKKQEDAYNQARATEAAARNALVAAATEKQAVDGFPALSKNVTDTLRKVSVRMAQGQWAEAEKFRAWARTALDGDKGTSVTSTKEWLDLSAKVDALQQKLQPQLDRIAQAEAARDRQLAAAQERQRQQESAQEQARQQAAVSDPTSLEGAEAIVRAYKTCMTTGRSSMARLASEGHSICVEHSVRDARCTREAHCERLDNPALCVDVSAAGLMCP